MNDVAALVFLFSFYFSTLARSELSGMFILLGRLPRTTDRCEWEDCILEVVDIDGKRIGKVLATRKPDNCEASTAALFSQG
jgi:hypothetical protein